MEEELKEEDTSSYSTDLFGVAVVAKEDPALDEGGKGSGGGPDFNIWSFTDAVGSRDKKQAWVLYRKALSLGLSPEEMFYKLVWQVKTLLLTLGTASAAEAEMKPYPYSKAKGNLKNWSKDELEELSRDLALGYHDARRGEGEVETLVEKILLRL